METSNNRASSPAKNAIPNQGSTTLEPGITAQQFRQVYTTDPKMISKKRMVDPQILSRNL